jgi:hypothetical protein
MAPQPTAGGVAEESRLRFHLSPTAHLQVLVRVVLNRFQSCSSCHRRFASQIPSRSPFVLAPETCLDPWSIFAPKQKCAGRPARFLPPLDKYSVHLCPPQEYPCIRPRFVGPAAPCSTGVASIVFPTRIAVAVGGAAMSLELVLQMLKSERKVGLVVVVTGYGQAILSGEHRGAEGDRLLSLRRRGACIS